MSWRQATFCIFGNTVRQPRTYYPDLISLSSSWASAYTSFFLASIPVPWVLGGRQAKLVKGVSVGNRDIKSNNWAYLMEMGERFRNKLQMGGAPYNPILLLQGRPPEAISSFDSRVKADRLMRKYMWARAKSCPNRELYGICSFGLWVNFYSLDLCNPHATILPREKEAVEYGWQDSIISEAARIKFEGIVDNLTRARSREWLRGPYRNWFDYDDKVVWSDDELRKYVPKEPISTQFNESLMSQIDDIFRLDVTYHLLENKMPEHEEKGNDDGDDDGKKLDPLEVQDREDEEEERIRKKDLVEVNPEEV